MLLQRIRLRNLGRKAIFDYLIDYACFTATWLFTLAFLCYVAPLVARLRVDSGVDVPDLGSRFRVSHLYQSFIAASIAHVTVDEGNPLLEIHAIPKTGCVGLGCCLPAVNVTGIARHYCTLLELWLVAVYRRSLITGLNG